MAIVLTVSHAGRSSSKSFEEGSVATDTVQAFVQEVTGLKKYVAKYRDDEGELCCLTAVTLSDALVQARFAGGDLRLEVTPLPEGFALPLQSRAIAGASPAKKARTARPAPEDSDSDDWVVVSDVEVSPGNATPASSVCLGEIKDGEDVENGDVPCWECNSARSSSAAASPVGKGDDTRDGAFEGDDDVRTPGAPSSSVCSSIVRGAGAPKDSAVDPTSTEENPQVVDDHVAIASAEPDVEDTVDSMEANVATAEATLRPEAVEAAEASAAVADSSSVSPDDVLEAVTDTHMQQDDEEIAVSTEANIVVEEEGAAAAVEDPAEPSTGTLCLQSQLEDRVLSPWDKACLVLAAFDGDDDGRLDWKEYEKLQKAAGCEDIDEDVYRTLCSDVDCAPATGFDVDGLLRLYTVRDTLEQEYVAAMKHFQEQEADLLDARPNAASRLRRAVGALLSRARRPLRSSEVGDATRPSERPRRTASQVPLLSLENFLEDEQAQCLTSWDKVGFMLAAFDANQDGHLNYQEHDALQRSIDGHLDNHVFSALCEGLGVDAKVGLGAHELFELHERWGTLEQAFSASVAKLQSVGGVAGGGLHRRVMDRLALPSANPCRIGLVTNPRFVSRDTFRMAQCA